MLRRLAAIALVLLLMPVSARADVEWTTWSGYPATTRTGTFERGFTVTMTPASFPGDGFRPEGTYFEADSPVAGMLTTANPPYQMILTGPAIGTLINPGDLVVDIDLSDLPANARPLLGILDQKFAYELQLLDDTDALLPLTEITFTPYNIRYFPPKGSTNRLVADQNTILDNIDTTKIRRDFLNDAVPTQYYQHTGLTVLSDLPAGTRTIRMLGGTISETEGVGLLIGAEFVGPTGDTNANGTVTASDALLTLQIAVGTYPVTPEILASSDMNGDGQITVVDALAILQLAVGS